MKSFRAQLLFSHLLPLLIVLPLLGAIFVIIAESQILLTNVVDDLRRTAVMVAVQAATDSAVWQDTAQAQTLIAQSREGLQREVNLLRPDGSLLAAQPVSVTTELPSLTAEDVTLLQAGQPVLKRRYDIALSRSQAAAFVPVLNAQRLVLGIVQVTDRLGEVYLGFQRLRLLMLLVVSAALVVALVLAWWLAQRTNRRLQSVALAVEQVAAGKVPVLEPATAPREFRTVLQAVQSLSNRLRSSEETRKHLLANLVHELGRPLAALQAAIHALQQGATRDATLSADLLRGMDDQVERLKPLLDNLASLYKQTSAAVVLQREPIELSVWLPQILITWQTAAQAKGLHWQVTIPDGLPVASIDSRQVAQAIGNLVANAIQYTPAEGNISIEAGYETDREAARVWIAVEDTGSGIAAEEAAHIFDPFYRGTRGRRFPQGMGLGLAIARDIVRAHGGDIKLQSEVGWGSRFTLELPVN